MMTAPNLSQKQLNFARFSIVCVDIIKLPLKDILNLYIKPAELENNIKSCPSLRTGVCKLNPDQQRKCCFISSNFPDYSKFDVPLLYKLIRNLCPTLEPTNKWGNKPTVKDVCVGDDIERIRVLRNAYFAHTESAEISNDEFKQLWQDAKCVVNRCQQFTASKGCKTDYNQMLTDLERQTLTFKEYTSGKERSRAIHILGYSDVLCGETASLEAELTLEEDVYLPISWDRVDELSRKHLDIKKDKYRGSNSRQLRIHRVCKDDEAGYQAVISRNQDVKIFSNEVYLRALGDPPCLEEITVTSENDEMHINYVFKNSFPFVKELRWTKNTLMLDLSNDKYRGGGLADNCITIKNPSEEDKGEYTCTVSNAVGSVSKIVKLDIPGIDILSKSKVTFGSETRINCDVSGYPPPDKVEWQNSIDGTTFIPIDIDGNKHFGSSTDPGSPYLLVRNATVKDQQYYRVVVSNLLGKCISNALFLQVTGNRPNTSEGTCTLSNHSVKLRCDVFLYDESPAVNDVYWTKNGIKLHVSKSDGKYSGVDINDPSLIINSVNHNDAGDYQLIAVNEVGETKSEVIVLGKGVPEVHLEKPDIKEDGSGWFTVTIKSVPVPHLVQWNVKEEHSKHFQPINVNAAEYKGTSYSFPHPVLVLNLIKRQENCIFEIEVHNRIGEVKREIPGELIQGNLKTHQRTVGKFYTDSGSRLTFAKLLNGLAEKFPTEKIPQLKHLIESSVILNDNAELQKATSAADCFWILQKEDIVIPSDVMAMQFLFKETKCKELEKECVEYAEKRKAMYFHEKSPENGYQNVRLHVVENVFYFNVEDETKIRETVANIVGCSIEDIRVNGYRQSHSFFLVLSIREIYIGRLFTIQQHDKDKLLKLKIDYFKDDLNTVHLGNITDEHGTSTLPSRLSSPEEVEVNKYHLSGRGDWLVHDAKGSTPSFDALCRNSLEFMAEVKKFEDPRESIYNCRLRVRKFNNKIKDAQLDDIPGDVPCKDCEESILIEASELNKECGWLIEHYNWDEISPSQISKDCCDTCSKEDIDYASQDNIFITMVMQRTRKRIHQYNDHLGDLIYMNRDGRPCKKCRERIRRECQGLIFELQRAEDQLKESKMIYKIPCDYGIECKHIFMKLRDGTKRKSNLKQRQNDSGYHSVSSDLHYHTVAPSCSYDIESPCGTLEVSMEDTNINDA